MTSKPRLVAPPPQFREQLYRPGGIARELAVAEAEEIVEELKDQFITILAREIVVLNEKAAEAATEISPADAAELAKRAGVIFNLAGTYRYHDLQAVAASLLDTLGAMQERNLNCAAPLMVHVKAAQLLAPCAVPLPPQGVALLIEQLGKVVQHLKAPAACITSVCSSCPATPMDE